MTQLHQILSKENNGATLLEQIEQHQAGQFALSTISQELLSLSEKLQNITLINTTFETIKKLLRSLRNIEMSKTVHAIFSGKK